jgi:hypothetical protein
VPYLPCGQPEAHNKAVTYGQGAAVCPQCGSAAAVHSIEELAAMARSRLGQVQGNPATGQPQAGPQPGWAGQPQGGPQPGWAAEPQAGALPGPGGQRSSYSAPQRSYGSDFSSGEGLGSLGDDVAGAAMGMAARFIGRAISRKMQDKVSQALPAMMAKQEAMLREQIAIAERHPDLRACLTDQVIFLAGGSRTMPMKGVMTNLTVEQADAVVAQLRG